MKMTLDLTINQKLNETLKKLCNLIFLASLFISLATGPLSFGETTETQNLSDSERLKQVIQSFTENVKNLDPYGAAYFNKEDLLGDFGDYPSEEYKVRAYKVTDQALDEIRKIPTSQLSPSEKVTHQLFKESLEDEINLREFPAFYLDMNQLGSRAKNYLEDSSPQLTSFPFTKISHFEAWIKRSYGFPLFVDRQIHFLREAIKSKYVHNCVIAQKMVDSIAQGTEPDIQKHPFLRPLELLPQNIDSKTKNRIEDDFRKATKDNIQPSFLKLSHFLKNDYLPNCRKSFGIGQLPNGKKLYQLYVQSHTGLKIEPYEIHHIGLREVARIRSEMEKIKRQLKFKGSLNDYFNFRRKSAQNYFLNRDEMLLAYQKRAQEIADVLPQYFEVIPQTQLQVVESEAQESPAAMYMGPTENKSFGRFILNTKNLKSSTRGSVTTLSLHEGQPGHHFHLALIFENQNLSEFQRKLYGNTAFTEGWALYAEYLGREMGLYKDPEQMFGHLSDELWRAVRLVVDTGIHSQKWSREKAIQYMKKNMASDLSNIETEVDRYAVWPGQALSYKLGQLKILELRKFAEKKLGQKFSVKEFHTQVLKNGTVSLPVLEMEIQNWVKGILKK